MAGVVACGACNRFWAPDALVEGGRCPTCAAELRSPDAEDETARAPWHFKLLVGAIILYLTWRVVQLIGWALQQL